MSAQEIEQGRGGEIERVGQAANVVAARYVFADYQRRRAEHTLRRQRADLALFERFLKEAAALSVNDLFTDADAWRGITWGLVQAFVNWQIGSGYAVGSINIHLSTVKTYARLAFRAGAIDASEHALIRTVTGYTHRESQNLDALREAQGAPQRLGVKKAEPVRLTDDLISALKHGQPDTPQGRRDALLLCLLLDHGLRCGELALLRVEHIDLDARELRFFRPKVAKDQTHWLTPDTFRAASRYLSIDALDTGLLLRASRKGGALRKAGMSTRAITLRVETLGKRLGVVGLSAHDGRHAWATRAARSGTDPFALQEAGGWSSLAMPRRYVEAAQIANEGVVLRK